MSFNECDEEFYNLTPTVPRVAEPLDDLRVGQVVALVAFPERRFIGEVLDGGMVTGAWDDGEVARFMPDDEDGWFILSDPPPEPVRVSREAFDRLADLVEGYQTEGNTRVDSFDISIAAREGADCTCKSTDACYECSTRRDEHADQPGNPYPNIPPDHSFVENPDGYPTHYADYGCGRTP